jgi:hypothetical protein
MVEDVTPQPGERPKADPDQQSPTAQNGHTGTRPAHGPTHPEGSSLLPAVTRPRPVSHEPRPGYVELRNEDDDRSHPRERFTLALSSPVATPPYRPHIIERALRRIDAFYLPRARARTAMVIVTPRSGPTPVGPDGRPTKVGEIFWNGGTLYEVDLGLHHTSVEIDLPARGDTSVFTLTAEVEWRVDKPEVVVADNVLDVRQALTLALRTRLSRHTREHDVCDVMAAEDDIRAELDRLDPGKIYGLRTTIVPRLTADEKAREFAANRRELEREIEIEDLRHQHKQLQERHEQELQEARRLTYREIMASGNVDQFALQLARNPEDVRAVVQLARAERDEERRQFTDFITRLLQSGAVDRWDVEDQVREALEWLAESTGRVIRTDITTLPRQRTAATSEEQRTTTVNGS